MGSEKSTNEHYRVGESKKAQIFRPIGEPTYRDQRTEEIKNSSRIIFRKEPDFGS